MSLVFPVLLLIAAVRAQSGGCLSQVNSGNVCACAGKPADNKYFLTAFDDGGGSSSCACGSCHQYGEYFGAGKSRWSCGAHVQVCRGTKCVNIAVVDFGPGCRIDKAAGGPVIDASPAVCRYLFGTSSCGYSDHFSVTGVEISRTSPLGPTTGGSVPQPVNGGTSTVWGSCNGIAGQCQDINTDSCASQYISGKCGGPSNIRCCPSSGAVSTPVQNNNPVVSSQWGACNGVAGQCQDTSTPCSGGAYISGKCPGPSNIRCCPTAAVSTPVQNNDPVDAGSSFGACSGVAGQCQNANVQLCAAGYLTGKCPGTPANIRCCPSGGSNPTVATPVISGSGGTFPVRDLSSISVNWGGSRSGGSRCHAGIDLYTSGSARVVAIAAGTVTAVMRGWYTCSGGTIDAIMVYHTSGPVAGKTINYGEVSPGSYSVSVGSPITAGQPLGTATRCGMLHMELYSGRQTASQRWYPQGSIGNAYNGCATRWLSTKPAALLDPRPLTQSLMPAGASTRGGTSFLNDDADPSTFADEENVADAPDDDASLSPGAIAACVIVGVLLLACIASLVTFFVLRRRDAAQVDVANAAFGMTVVASGGPMSARSERPFGASDVLPDDLLSNVSAPTMGAATLGGMESARYAVGGSFVCQHCQKAYNYADDLAQHVALRHAA